MTDINNGQFTICSGVLDTQKKFKKYNLIEQQNCCLQTCLPTIIECRKICSGIKDNNTYLSCIEKCNVDIKNSCENNCKLINNNFGFTNPIYNGTRKFGCGDGYYDNINIDCLKKNKNNIIQICKDNCSLYTECDLLCDDSYNKLENPSKSLLYSKPTSNLIYNNEYKYTLKIFYRSVGITLLICIFTLIFLKKN